MTRQKLFLLVVVLGLVGDGFIRGFQRWVWWPKCAPASINCCMVTVEAAINNTFPVRPPIEASL